MASAVALMGSHVAPGRIAPAANAGESAYITGTTLVVDGGATSTPNWGFRENS